MAQRRSGSISLGRARHLALNLSCGGLAFPVQAGASLAELEAGWTLIGDEMLDTFRERNPGSRPWAWWEFDLCEPRLFGLDALRRLLDLGELDRAEQDRVVAAGVLMLRFAPFSGRPPSVPEANLVRVARGEDPLPIPYVCTPDCERLTDLARRLVAAPEPSP